MTPTKREVNPKRAAALQPLADHLRAIHVACGAPSLRSLRRRTPWLVQSTTSEVLGAKTAPKLDFVLEFHRLCLEIAAESGLDVPAALADPDTVRRLWNEQVEQLESPREGRAGIANAPTAPAGLVGRGPELRWLDERLEPKTDRCALVALDGMPGVGKTALAVTWASQRRARFPDGVRYIDLRGASPSGRLEPTVALRRLLKALGEPTDDITDMEEFVDRYRLATSRRRLCVLLDNAGDEAQVRPLLPSRGACLVTARQRLSGLAVGEGAQLACIEPLNDMTGAAIITDRATVSTGDAEALSALVGGLPLALRLIAELIATQVASTAALLAERDESKLVALLDGATADPTVQVHILFEQTLTSRTAEERRVVTCFAESVCHDLPVHALAAMIDRPVDATRALVRALVDGHVLTSIGDNRVVMHDLYRAWARTALSEPDDTAQRRLLHYYVVAADAMDRTLLPARDRPELPVEFGLVDRPAELADYDGARRWGVDETDNVVALTAEAVRLQEWKVASLLPHIMMSLFNIEKPWTQWIEMYERAARAIDHFEALDAANVLNGLGIAYRETMRWDRAIAVLARAERAFATAGSAAGRAMALNNRALCEDALGDLSSSIATLELAWSVIEDTDDYFRQAVVSHNLAEGNLKSGRADRALEWAQTAIDAGRKAGDDGGVATGLTTVGEAYLALSQPDPAEDALREALATQRRLGDRHGLGFTTRRLAKLLAEAGRREDALTFARESLATFSALGDERQIVPSRELLEHISAET